MTLARKLAAEAFGTFALVFAGTGAIVTNHVSGGAVSHVGVALTFGLVVMAMIYAVGAVSGAHLNPAVTLAFCAAGRFPARQIVPYAAAQVAGAFAASGLVLALFGNVANLGATLPSGGVWQSFALEVALTLILMLVILRVSTGSREQGVTAALAVGGVVALEALFAGPICGASMNPARSLAPAVCSGSVRHLWAYLAAPALGALAAVPLAALMRHHEGAAA